MKRAGDREKSECRTGSAANDPSGADSSSRRLKEEVRRFWDEQSCDTQVATAAKFSREYFESIENFRYRDQPFIHSFAQFSRYHKKRVLEVGFGAGTDFIQWLRAGAIASGIDLTTEALANLTERIRVYGLPQPEALKVSDAENLPFASNHFDLGYSFGVLHHTPDTERAVNELVRVVRPGGEIKIMLYNRHSIYAAGRWIKYALLRGRPWKTLTWALANYMESAGTKGYTRRELHRWLTRLELSDIEIRTEMTSADYLSGSAIPPLNWMFRACLRLSGPTFDWHPGDYVERVNAPGQTGSRWQRPSKASGNVTFTGNRLGFFHCISAKKRG